MSDPRVAALSDLRRQQEQARLRLGVQAPIARGDALQTALKRAEGREREATESGGIVYSPPFFRYPTATERLRWARTRDILARSSPGPDEDGVYLEMIARQAASVEVILRQEHTAAPHLRNHEICDRVLLGTFPTLHPDAFARRSGDFFFVQVSAGLIEFVYQLAKAVVLSWKPVAPEGGGGYSFRCAPEDVAEVLAENPLPLQRLRLTLETYLFLGLPRAVGFSPPATNYQAPLTVLTAANERFVLAHEYSHTLHDALDVVHPGGSLQSEEFASDLLAFHLAAESGLVLDRLPPNLSTQGAFFVLTALDLLRQALDLARHGEVREDRGFAGHPPAARRLAALGDCYRQTVTAEDDDRSIRLALHPAGTLELLWGRLLEEGAAAGWRERELHRTWQGL